MSVDLLNHILESTGYMHDGAPAPGVRLGPEARRNRRGHRFAPDASWTGATTTTVYFKYAEDRPDEATISTWHREIWNERFAPLLWIISPNVIELYNGFSRPDTPETAASHQLRIFETIEQHLVELEQVAGRLVMESGQFWSTVTGIDRKGSVDEQLLSDLAYLEYDLIEDGMERESAQGLIGRSIFTQYLVDREIVGSSRLQQECGALDLPAALRNSMASQRLFRWLTEVFNGDIFLSQTIGDDFNARHLSRIADFLEAVDPQTGQRTFFPYQFDIIPVELISSIYEQFAHSARLPARARSKANDSLDRIDTAKKRGVHYTRLSVVSLILDEVMNSASGSESVLDLTCGSGVFLVEAFRRLVERKGGNTPQRDLIRTVLYNQIFGVDISDAAVQVAAFSLYLAALELDPDPKPPEALRFERLIGRNLLVGDARDIETQPHGRCLLENGDRRRTFDIIVGNPPWTFRGRAGTAERRSRQLPSIPLQPRGEGFDFILRAADFGHKNTRYGIVSSAMPFFSASKTGISAALHVVDTLAPVTLVNLAPLTKWLFPTANMPAMVLLARDRDHRADVLTLVNVPWSPSAEKSHTFEISRSDISFLSVADWRQDPKRLKSAMFGTAREIVLLDRLRAQFDSLNRWFDAVGSHLRDGMILGRPERRTRDATHLSGLEMLESRDIEPFRVPSKLNRFRGAWAQWPRSRNTYSAPLLIVKEFFRGGPRLITAVAERDLVFTDAYFAASLPQKHLDSAYLIAGIFSSAFASWFYLMTASEFGIWKRRLLTADVGFIPMPDHAKAIRSDPGRRVISLVKEFSKSGPTGDGFRQLDDAVFDLYGIDDIDQVVVQDGFSRAKCQWVKARDASGKSAGSAVELQDYAHCFVSTLDGWLQATKTRHVRGEIYTLPESAPFKVVRFVIGEGRKKPSISFVTPDGGLKDVLGRIGDRLEVQIATALVGERELRVHSEREVVIIKPAARRFWTRAKALEDADTVVSESFTGVAV